MGVGGGRRQGEGRSSGCPIHSYLNAHLVSFDCCKACSPEGGKRRASGSRCRLPWPLFATAPFNSYVLYNVDVDNVTFVFGGDYLGGVIS